MIKQYSGYEAKKVSTREALPAGGYVCKIMDAKVQDYSWGSVLILAHDVVEGEYKDHWRKDYAANTNEDKKWRGNLRINLPKDDGSDQDAWTKSAFNNFVWAVQESNPGYTWNWDESALKGKALGILYRNREWAMNGNSGWTTEAAGATSVDDIRSGSFRIPKDKPLANKNSTAPVFTPVANADDDLPF